MIKFLKKYKKNIVVLLMLFIMTIIILKVFELNYYKVDMKTVSKKSISYYKNSDSNNSYIVAKFMKYISDEEYETAFELLEKNNKKDMFNNDPEEFMNKLKSFNNFYSKLEYSTIFSREQKDYIDEEIMCMICDEEQIVKHSIRFNIRTYKGSKEASIIILSIS